MKNYRFLLIARHSKSDWGYNGIADKDRPLKAKGIKNAYEIARRLKLDHNVPDLIITSPANRALHTAVIYADICEVPFEHLRINTDLYESSTGKIIDIVKETSNEVSTLMIVGHNPDFTDLTNAFIKESVENVPTSGVVILKFDADTWKNINKDTVIDQQFFVPE